MPIKKLVRIGLNEKAFQIALDLLLNGPRAKGRRPRVKMAWPMGLRQDSGQPEAIRQELRKALGTYARYSVQPWHEVKDRLGIIQDHLKSAMEHMGPVEEEYLRLNRPPLEVFAQGLAHPKATLRAMCDAAQAAQETGPKPGVRSVEPKASARPPLDRLLDELYHQFYVCVDDPSMGVTTPGAPDTSFEAFIQACGAALPKGRVGFPSTDSLRRTHLPQLMARCAIWRVRAWMENIQAGRVLEPGDSEVLLRQSESLMASTRRGRRGRTTLKRPIS